MKPTVSVTIFTPTYNRAYSLSRLYESLINQSIKDFEWIVINDGSTDNTKELLASFVEECTQFPINVVHTSNFGKYRAINQGMKLANGRWFFIVDSDDWLPQDALAKVLEEEKRIKETEKVAVLCGMRYTPAGKRVGGDVFFETIECTPFDFRYRRNIGGDFAELIRTDILRDYPFPELPGERFCPESVLFNRIALKFLTHYFPENIYICDYQKDGLSARIDRLRMQNWRASLLCYHIQAHCPVPIKIKIRSWINFWRFYFCADVIVDVSQYNVPYWAMLLKPLGWMFFQKDRKK